MRACVPILISCLALACSSGEVSESAPDGGSIDSGTDLQARDAGADAAPRPTKDSMPLPTPDAASPDAPPADSAPASDSDTNKTAALVPPAVCTSKHSLVYQEIAVGYPDYVALKNTSSATLDLGGYKLILSGISPSAPEVYVLDPGLKLGAGEVLYLFEHSTGSDPGDVNLGGNIPFFDGPPNADKDNSAALYDPYGHLLDYFAVGNTALNLPAGASFTPLPWPSGFDSYVHSFQRAANAGSCPHFYTSDWKVADLTR